MENTAYPSFRDTKIEIIITETFFILPLSNKISALKERPSFIILCLPTNCHLVKK